ncbi:acetolactate synthase small subunit [Buchnera aphidicola]|uniref:Acetolactate synthase small subunit n=1 Tax=Buchnera aphidicola subsp. Tuberolachnus salignus TaxID=98804 RepID=A0A160SWW3_BUCTT|nr:acetolactate synthase small subunit [Buchnera aphidicola]CUR53128.1 Acetolactate synthase isozyme 3 small subunit [Buchnera aphidicola (Tuberolachnus salignus)]
MQYILLILLENEVGALSRVVGLFSQRNYNIDQLTVVPTQNKLISNINIHTSGDLNIIKQIIKQLEKLINVIQVKIIKESNYIQQKLYLIKIFIENNQKFLILKKILYEEKGEILYKKKLLYVIKIHGTPKTLNILLKKIKKKFKILKLESSGTINIIRSH